MLNPDLGTNLRSRSKQWPFNKSLATALLSKAVAILTTQMLLDFYAEWSVTEIW